MKRTFFLLFKFFFTVREDSKIVQNIETFELINIISQIHHGEIISLLPFSDFRVRACIHEIKFHDNPKALEIIATVLHTYLLKENVPTIIIPIPLSTKRKYKRGYNQVERIALASIQNTSCIIETGVLYREKDTSPQTSLKKSERLKNIKDAFKVFNNSYPKNKINGQHIILLDDVTTTGATLKEAKATLLPLSPASITCLAIAH